MRIDRLTLKNFYAFEEFSVDLHPELTVLVGRNGSGKSTVLEGLGVALGAWLSGFASIKEDLPIHKAAPRLLRHESKGLATMEAQYPVSVGALGQVSGQQVQWERELRTVGGRTTHASASAIRQLAADAEATLATGSVDLPVLSYYGTGRIWLSRRDVQRDESQLGSRLMGYRSALASASDPKHFEAWMRWRTEDQLQRLAQAQDAGGPLTTVASEHLEAVQRAAGRCLADAQRFYYSVNHRELRVVLRSGLEIPFHSLSDGQRSVLAVAADIAWRAAQLNPHHGAEAAERAHGVVLIDEIDQHLHPAWQRRVVGDLRATFPNVQFVMTTHSPQILSTVSSENVRLLDGSAAHPISRTRGRDANTILEQVFGVGARPDDAQAQLDELARAIDDGDLLRAKSLLAALQDAIGTDDATLIAAEWEIRASESLDVAD